MDHQSYYLYMVEIQHVFPNFLGNQMNLGCVPLEAVVSTQSTGKKKKKKKKKKKYSALIPLLPEEHIQGSFGFQENSETRVVFPPCTNNNSGGPSSSSSGVFSISFFHISSRTLRLFHCFFLFSFFRKYGKILDEFRTLKFVVLVPVKDLNDTFVDRVAC
eukprot:TRINITY_DN19654_c0_g1_i2.p2 TRINITY_DN19654_c0_g1~~TRINITY_DN19654_c0_g1_i2.p2  ORF type:complete len:160 (-),score=45.42 TRINITY_DN19654_c0_g1_i2:107-586(-)